MAAPGRLPSAVNRLSGVSNASPWRSGSPVPGLLHTRRNSMPSRSFCELHRKQRKCGFCDPLRTSTHSACCFCFFFLPHREACGILLPCPGIKPVSPSVEAWSPNHWTAREVLTPLAFSLLPQPLLVPVTLCFLQQHWPDRSSNPANYF